MCFNKTPCVKTDTCTKTIESVVAPLFSIQAENIATGQRSFLFRADYGTSCRTAIKNLYSRMLEHVSINLIHILNILIFYVCTVKFRK